ncbi:hypothetical protein DFH11DRAFT_661257 [Phellopilus nigrolimitatus]|nr:hypothetical protein DFH11DRAFT_661257 [Phellopilus nigrolimitatus]
MSWRHKHSIRFICTAVLIYGLIAPASAFSSTQSQNVRSTLLHGLSRRQDSPSPFLAAPPPATLTTSPSFDYWWPYPLASATPPPLSTASPDKTVAGDSLSSAATSTNSGDEAASSTRTVSDFNLSSGTATIQSSTSGGDTTHVTITALPPLKSTPKSVYPHSAYHKPFNLVLLTPLFGLIGCTLGAACGWWGYGLWKDRRESSRDDMLVGPRYVGVEEDVDFGGKKDNEKYTHEYAGKADKEEGVTEGQQLLETSRTLPFASSHRREGGEALETPPEAKGELAWPRAGLSTLLRSPLLARYAYGRIEDTPDPNEGTEIRVSQLNVRSESLAVDPRKKAAGHDGMPVDDLGSPFAPTVFSSVVTSDEDDDEDYEDARQTAGKRGTIRHKSIRCRIAEKLQVQFSPRRGFLRQKLKEGGDRKGTPELEEGVLLQDNLQDIESPSASSGLRTKKTVSHAPGHGRAISDFTILADSPQKPSRAYVDSGSTPGNAIRNAPTFNTPLNDKYTPLPVRKSRSARKCGSPQRLIERADPLDISDVKIVPSESLTAHRHILPASPPRLSTPRLDSDLFFSPGIGSAVPLSQTSESKTCERLVHSSPTRGSSGSQARESPVRYVIAGPRQPNKLRSKQSPGRNVDSRVQGRNKALPPSPPRRFTGGSTPGTPTKAA